MPDLSKAHQLRGKETRAQKQLREAMKKAPKYGNVAGDGFRSGLERDVAQMLTLMKRAGEITDFDREVSIELVPGIKHKLDFVVHEKEGKYGIEAKGATCATWSLKRRLYIAFGKFPIQVWKKENSRLGISEIIPPGKYEVREK